MLFERPLPSLEFESDAALPFAAEDDSDAAEVHAEALLIRALVYEVQTAAALTAAAASAVNTAGSPHFDRVIVQARTAIADFPARIDHWPQRILQEHLTRGMFEDVAVYYATFNKAKCRLLALPCGGGDLNDGNVRSKVHGPLTTSWRLAARHARLVATELTNEAKLIVPDGFFTNLNMIDYHLARAAEGLSPCVTAEGKVEVPQLAERRRMPRRWMLQTANIRAGNMEFTAFVKDVSPGGFGLTRMPEFAIGQSLVIHLQCGRAFSGTIAWCDGETAGMRLDRMLLPTDPLLFG